MKVPTSCTTAGATVRDVDTESPEYLLARLREREHVLAGVIRAQESWQEVLEIVADSGDADEARERLRLDLGFSQDQAVAVVDMQFCRMTRLDRQRIASEQEDIRARIRALKGD